MPATVLTLTENNGRSGYVLGVFNDSDTAVDAARANAAFRVERCRIQDAKSFGANDGHPDCYEVVVQAMGEVTDILVRHVPSGEHDDMSWHVRSFEVVEP